MCCTIAWEKWCQATVGFGSTFLAGHPCITASWNNGGGQAGSLQVSMALQAVSCLCYCSWDAGAGGPAAWAWFWPPALPAWQWVGTPCSGHLISPLAKRFRQTQLCSLGALSGGCLPEQYFWVQSKGIVAGFNCLYGLKSHPRACCFVSPMAFCLAQPDIHTLLINPGRSIYTTSSSIQRIHLGDLAVHPDQSSPGALSPEQSSAPLAAAPLFPAPFPPLGPPATLAAHPPVPPSFFKLAFSFAKHGE